MKRPVLLVACLAVFGLSVPAESPKKALPKREPEKLTMTLAFIADSEKKDGREYVFVLNGVVAYRTVEGLKKHIKGLPKGSTLTWAPGCCRIGKEPLLSSDEDMKKFRLFCESCGVKLVIVPSG